MASRICAFHHTIPALGVVVLASATVALAQERGRNGVVITLEESLEYSDNPDFVDNPTEKGFSSVTRLGFSVNRETSNQSFSLGGRTEYSTGVGDSEFDNTSVRFNYSIFNRTNRFELNARYRTREIDDVFTAFIPGDLITDPESPDFGGVSDPTILTGDGTEERINYGTNYIAGEDGPVELRFGYSVDELNYSETTDNSLYDRKTERFSTSLGLRITPTAQLRFFASREDYEADDDVSTDRITDNYGVGLSMDITPARTFDFALSQDDITTDTITGREVGGGTGFELGFTEVLKNGALRASAQSQVDFNGRRNTGEVSRSMALPNAASLTFGVGLVDTEVSSPSPLISFSYAQSLPDGDFRVSLSQEGRTNSDEDEVIYTKLNANYSVTLTSLTNLSLRGEYSEEEAQTFGAEDRSRIVLGANLISQINDISSWSTGLTYSDTTVNNDSLDDDERQFGITLGYRRAITNDWDLVASFRHARLKDDAGSSRSENAISLGVSRAFSF